VEPLRPDLPVPLPPADRWAAAVRFALTLLREPAFDRAHRRTVWLVVVAVVLIVAGQFLFVGWLREPVTTLGVALAAYTALRVAALRVVEHRQRAFAPAWLAARSAELRAGRFEVVRCTVDRRGYDLSDPAAVRDLLERPGESRVQLDFVHEPATLERVYRKLRDVTVQAAKRAGSPATARFTEARYALRPGGTTSYWQLGTRVVITTAAPASSPARAAFGADGQSA
jgi:hypothetical protein